RHLLLINQRLSGLQDGSLIGIEGRCKFSRKIIEIRLPEQILWVLRSDKLGKCAVCNYEPALLILHVDVVGHVIDHRAQQIVLSSERILGLLGPRDVSAEY